MKFKLILALTLSIFSMNSFTQTRGLPREALGSTPKVQGVYNQDLKIASEMAMPSFNEDELGNYIENIYKKYPNGIDSLKINRELAQSLFGIKLPEGDGEEQGDNYAFEVMRKMGKFYLHRNRENIKPYSLTLGQQHLRLSKILHKELLLKFGIDQEQLFALNSNLLLVEGIQRLVTGGYSKPTTPLVDDIYTYGNRMVDGIMVEGSYAKIFSKNTQNFEGMIIKWPRFQFHPNLSRFELKRKADLLNEIIPRLREIANPKHESNVKMAIVFRPVFIGADQVFVPSLKVGLYTRPMNDRQAEAKGENGALFYVDIMKQQLAYTLPREKDDVQGGE